MKTIIMAAMLAAAPLLAAAQKSVTIENPVVAGKSVFTQGLFVEKVEASKAATKIYFKMYHGWAEGWAQISGESFISANGKSLQQISVDGVPINEHFFGKGDNFTSEFSITFPPVDKGVDAVDYIECSGPTCFRIFGIPLTQEASSRNKAEQERLEAEFSKESKVSDDGKPLPGNRLMIGQSTLKGRLAGFRKDLFGNQEIQILCYINNPLTGNQDEVFANVDDSGCFEIAFPLTSEHQTVGLQTSPAAFVNQTFLASVNGTQEIVIDLHKMAANPQGHFCYYKGSNADINTAINTVERDSIGISYNKIMEFDGTTAMEFKSHISNLARAAEQYISQSNMPLKAKEYAKINLRGNQGYYLGTAEIYMEMAYRKKHNIEDRRAPIPDFKRPQMGLQYAQYIQELNLCSPDMLFSNNLGNAISQFRFVAQSTMGSPLEVQRSVLKTMIDNGNSDEIAAKLLEITSSKAKEEKPAFSEEEIGIINQFNEKYMDEFANTAAQYQDAKIQEILGGCKGFFAECLKAQPILNTLRSRTPISGSGMKAIEEIGNPFITEYAKMLNSKLIDKIEADKARGGYFLHQTSETEADSILVDILKGHEGKVAYIDIWNTWCGPCRMGIEAMKRHHDEYKKKGVDFIYVADESSPEDEYNNTIVGMQGDHFRLSSEAMNKLSEKFDISGIPFYIFINKKGEVAATQSGFGGAEIILEKLDQLLAE